MGMPCEVNSILKLNEYQGYPLLLEHERKYQGQKKGYRIMPIDVPIQLVNAHWFAYADIIIHELTWKDNITYINFKVCKIYENPFQLTPKQ